VESALVIHLLWQDWCIPYEVSCTGENIAAVTIYNKHEVVFVNVITNTIINTVDIGHQCNTSLPSGNMSHPDIRTHFCSLASKLTVVFLVSCGITSSLFSCGTCACSSQQTWSSICKRHYQHHYKHGRYWPSMLWNRFQHESSSHSSFTSIYIKSHCKFRSRR
jgi:hypothetical protein